MKSKLLILAILGVLFASCQKASVDEPAPLTSVKLYSVGFNVLEFRDTAAIVTTNAVSTNSISALKDQIDYLQYYVFTKEANGNYVLVKQKIQKSTEANFGAITDSLPASHYYIYFVGCQAPGHMEMKTKATGVALPIFYYDNGVIYDTFYAAAEITVDGKLTQAISLNRVVTKIQIKFNDILPQKTASCRFWLADYPVGLDMTTGMGELRAQTETAARTTKVTLVTVSSLEKINPGYTYTTLVWAYDYPSILVGSVDSNGATLASRSLPKNRFGLYIRLENNVQYNYSGFLQSTQGFGVATNRIGVPDLNAAHQIQ